MTTRTIYETLPINRLRMEVEFMGYRTYRQAREMSREKLIELLVTGHSIY